MVFSSNIFLFLFLPIVFLCYFGFTKSIGIRNLILLFFSLVFYCFGEIEYLWLLLISLVCNYFFGIFLDKNLSNNSRKKLIIFLAIFFNISLLGYYKYYNFFQENLQSFLNINLPVKSIILPLGISFFTFHSISYLVDIYRKKCHVQKNFFNLALYICFFPQLISGPIVRYNFISKYLTNRKIHHSAIAFGIRLFLIGFTKKILIANPLGELADSIFNSNPQDLNRLIGIVGVVSYTLQIYFDFSGYCDMAIGLARIFGFRFPINFNYPYIALSIKDFWRRWHISLSTWFRDYVYIPLGGNRVGLFRQYFNLILVFFLCGLWHQASWNCIIWGLFHGSFLVLERFKFYQKILENLPKIFQNFYMLFLVMIGWIFFRSNDLSSSINLLKIIAFDNPIQQIPLNIAKILNSHFLQMSFILAIIGYSPIIKNLSKSLIHKNKIFVILIDVILILSFLLSIIRLSSQTHNPFIYFQF